jgi:amino acid transporter
VWLVVGVASYLNLPDTMLQRDIDPMWFTIMVAQVGLFLLLTVGFVRFFDRAGVEKRAVRARRVSFVRRYGVAGLSVFLLETPVRELLAKALTAVAPGWNDTMGGALLFGASLVVMWGFVLLVWERSGYAYSVERLMVRAMARLGKRSTKLDGDIAGPVAVAAAGR